MKIEFGHVTVEFSGRERKEGLKIVDRLFALEEKRMQLARDRLDERKNAKQQDLEKLKELISILGPHIEPYLSKFFTAGSDDRSSNGSSTT